MDRHTYWYETNLGEKKMKFAIVLVHVRTCVLTIEGHSSDDAVYKAKKEAIEQKQFDKRLGTIMCAEVIEVGQPEDSNEPDTS